MRSKKVPKKNISGKNFQTFTYPLDLVCSKKNNAGKNLITSTSGII